MYKLLRYLDMALDENSGVRKQDGYRVVTGVSSIAFCNFLNFNV